MTAMYRQRPTPRATGPRQLMTPEWHTREIFAKQTQICTTWAIWETREILATDWSGTCHRGLRQQKTANSVKNREPSCRSRF